MSHIINTVFLPLRPSSEDAMGMEGGGRVSVLYILIAIQLIVCRFLIRGKTTSRGTFTWLGIQQQYDKQNFKINPLTFPHTIPSIE